jgi:hypothetical protein
LPQILIWNQDVVPYGFPLIIQDNPSLACHWIIQAKLDIVAFDSYLIRDQETVDLDESIARLKGQRIHPQAIIHGNH